MGKRRKTKHAWGLYLGLALGLILVALPFGYGAYNQHQQVVRRDRYVQTSGDTATLRRKAGQYNQAIFAQQQAQGKADGQAAGVRLLGSPHATLGYLAIPAIKLAPLMVYYGTSDWALQRGIGNLTWTSLPTGGKNTLSVLTGHSGLANQIYFDNIRHLKRGDVIYLTTFGQKKAYAVTRRTVIDPKNQAQYRRLNIHPGRDEIGLLTCTPLFINTHRLVVFAKRIPLKQAARQQVTYRNWWSVEHLILLAILLFLAGLGGALLWQRRRGHDHTHAA